MLYRASTKEFFKEYTLSLSPRSYTRKPKKPTDVFPYPGLSWRRRSSCDAAPLPSHDWLPKEATYSTQGRAHWASGAGAQAPAATTKARPMCNAGNELHCAQSCPRRTHAAPAAASQLHRRYSSSSDSQPPCGRLNCTKSKESKDTLTALNLNPKPQTLNP